MITVSQIEASLRRAAQLRGQRLELKDPGERGSGRLTLRIRRRNDIVLAEWYGVWWTSGRRAYSKIGSYPAMSLADARKKFRQEYAPAIMIGETPKRAIKNPERPATVEELFRAYVAKLEAAGKRSTKEVERNLLTGKRNVADVIGRRKPAADVTSADVVRALKRVYQRGAVLAARTRSYVHAAFNYGLRAGHDYTCGADAPLQWGLTSNPVGAVPIDANSRRVGNRFLSPKEVRLFWEWLEARKGSSLLSSAARLQIVLGQRVEEILQISNNGFERSTGIYVWDRTKNGLPHAIPVPQTAIDIIDELVLNRFGFYFANRAKPMQPARASSLLQVTKQYIAESGAEPFTPRDLRRTWKTLAGRAGLSKEIRDRLQNHAQNRDVGSRHYDRYDYLTEKRAAMAKWDAYLRRILAGELDDENGADVVSIAATAA